MARPVRVERCEKHRIAKKPCHRHYRPLPSRACASRSARAAAAASNAWPVGRSPVRLPGTTSRPAGRHRLLDAVSAQCAVRPHPASGVSHDAASAVNGDGLGRRTVCGRKTNETGQVIVLNIDEAQHAITSTVGTDAWFALKAARDELNSSAHHCLRIVATGSNRDKSVRRNL